MSETPDIDVAAKALDEFAVVFSDAAELMKAIAARLRVGRNPDAAWRDCERAFDQFEARVNAVNATLDGKK